MPCVLCTVCLCLCLVGMLSALSFSRTSSYPTTNGGVQNGSSVGIDAHCTHVFCTIGDLYARSVHINKISALELSRKFIKSPLLVGCYRNVSFLNVVGQYRSTFLAPPPSPFNDAHFFFIHDVKKALIETRREEDRGLRRRRHLILSRGGGGGQSSLTNLFHFCSFFLFTRVLTNTPPMSL